jgi:predicted TIM-barrel fold metal-dependent hydrolase
MKPETNARPIIDTHQHLWDLDLFRYSWLSGYSALNRSFRMSDYLSATEDLNVVKSVLIEADIDEPYLLDETKYLLALCDRVDNPLAGVVAAARPERDDFRNFLDQLAGHPALKGVRRVLHTQPDDIAQQPCFIKNIAALSDYNLTFDICVLSRQLPVAVQLASRCPDVTFILDHCGVPQVKDKVLEPWRTHIAELAQLPNVICKISGLVAYADPQRWTLEDLRPYVENSIACFGWDRVLFGSDWPVCTLSATYERWKNALLSLTASSGEQNQRKLFYDNAARVYRLGGDKPTFCNH